MFLVLNWRLIPRNASGCWEKCERFALFCEKVLPSVIVKKMRVERLFYFFRPVSSIEKTQLFCFYSYQSRANSDVMDLEPSENMKAVDVSYTS